MADVARKRILHLTTLQRTGYPMSKPGAFDFGLNAEQERRAAALHSESIVWDWLSPHVGGPNIFSAYPEDLQSEFRRLMASMGSGMAAYATAVRWPYGLALMGRSD